MNTMGGLHGLCTSRSSSTPPMESVAALSSSFTSSRSKGSSKFDLEGATSVTLHFLDPVGRSLHESCLSMESGVDGKELRGVYVLSAGVLFNLFTAGVRDVLTLAFMRWLDWQRDFELTEEMEDLTLLALDGRDPED